MAIFFLIFLPFSDKLSLGCNPEALKKETQLFFGNSIKNTSNQYKNLKKITTENRNAKFLNAFGLIALAFMVWPQ